MSYKSVILADSPAGYWRIGELTGTNADDSTANNRDGTYTSTYTLGASTLQADGDAGLTLSGAGYVTMGDVAAFEFTGAFSAEAWINTTSAAAGSIVGKFAATNIGWLVFMVAGGTLRFLAYTGAGVAVFTFDTALSYNDGRWHHVVCTWDGTTGANKVQIYVDGVVVKQGTASAGTPGTGADPFVIGANASTFVNKITASLDEVAVYGSELTATRIMAHYAARDYLEFSDYTVLVNSVDVSMRSQLPAVEIQDELNEAPNSATVIVERTVPVIGQTLEVRVVNTTVFKGTITGVTQLQTHSATRQRFRCDATDGMYLLDRRLVNRDFVNWSGTSIANNVISSFTSGFTTANVPTSLVAVDLPNKMEPVSQTLSRLANAIGGFWYLDYTNDLHLRTTEVLGHPQPLDTTKLFSYRDLAYTRTVPPTTRVYVEGDGTTTIEVGAVGATTLKVTDGAMFSAAGGTAIAGSQILTYTSRLDGYDPSFDWTGQTAAAAIDWNTVVYAPALALFAAVGLNGAVGNTIMTSPDGVTWTSRTAPSTNGWQCICWSPDLTLFCAVASSGTSRVMTSSDGITWTARTESQANTWRSICWSPSLDLFVAVSSDGVNRVMTSPDGTTWTNRTAAAANSWRAVCWADTLVLFVAVSSDGASQVMTSPDGTTWTSRTAAAASDWNAVAWSSSLGLLAAHNGSTNNSLMTSPDGTTWTARTSPGDPAVFGWSNNGLWWCDDFNLFVSVSGNNGSVDVTTRVRTSANGIAWSLAELPGTGLWKGVACGGGQIVVIGATGSEFLQVIRQTGTPFSQLRGIPSSGTGSITQELPSGTDINLLVTRNDTAAQTALAALEGGDGIHERYIQDRRLSEDGAEARGDAELTLGSDPEDALTFISEDPFMISGRTVTVNIASISVSTQIKQVKTFWERGRRLPQRAVTATNVFKTLYQYLRDLDDRSRVD